MTRIERGQVWQSRDVRERRSVVVDATEAEFVGDTMAFVYVHNESTGRRSRLRAGVFARLYRLAESTADGAA